MDSSLKIQMDVKNNAQELQNYMLDLSNWEEEMRKKEIALNSEKSPQVAIPPPRNKIKRSKPDTEKNHSNKPKKISAYDYSAWEKFDVEKACAEVDKEDSDGIANEEEISEKSDNEVEEEIKSDLNQDNKNLSLIDEAFYEKELGNQFVKKGQWVDAIKCYTNAINLDSSNAIYYANRSLCFLKLKNLKSAETDATTAIQLDENYVKAYQRRALARLALGQLAEAKSDYLQVLKLEPKNSSAKAEISKIDEKLNKEKIIPLVKKKTFDHKNIFKSEENKPENITLVDKKENKTTKSIYSVKNKTATPKKPSKNEISNDENEVKNAEPAESVVNSKELKSFNKVQSLEQGDGDKKVSVQATEKMPHIFKPLPEWCKIVHPVYIPPHKRSKKPLRRIGITTGKMDEAIDFAGDAKTKCDVPCEKKEEKILKPENKNDPLQVPFERLSLEVPKTAVQFQNCWKVIKNNPEECYSYLKKIPGKELVHIFENSLESDFFSELITFLASGESKKEPELVYDFLSGLSKVKRFSSLVMFMSEADRTCVKQCISELEKVLTKEQVSELIRSYELKILNHNDKI